ncbi:MAG: carboxypeptidase regulatory-like domain-containing protein [Oscillospiraceae bacterium]|nr:carboxypeptidase regulatory-like domain-containing protein [Oscillospiraceae bacterium]
MNRQEFEDTAKRYREELFRMYASRNPVPPPRPGSSRPPVPPSPPRPGNNRPPAPPPPPRPDNNRPPVPPPFPPILPVLAEADNPAEETALSETQEDTPEEPALPKRAYTGFIRVHTVTAEGARPVAGAAVTVVRFISGEPELVALQTTDDSGETETITVPSPPPSADQRHPSSFLYDITVSAEGYYREHSTDVPVFPGVTSVQTFVMIPLPEGGGAISGGDLTYYNDMPQI